MKAEQLTEPLAFHGEGPFWDGREERLLFVDMLDGTVVSLRNGSSSRHRVGTVAAVIRARTSGGFVLALERGFAFADANFASIEPLHPVFDSPLLRMNEGGCDPAGRLFVGSMAYSEDPGAGSLYRLDPDHTVHTVLPAVTISNGLQWNADGTRAFYIDSPTGRVDVFDYDVDTAELSNRRPFVTEVTAGAPDGMAIDTDDGIWVALWGGSAVQHFDAAGRLVETIELPVSHVTACTFGGPGLDTLYITTSRLGVADGDEPEAGAIFTHQSDVRGAVPFAFAG